jgi:ketosteroid isomerase-like protein
MAEAVRTPVPPGARLPARRTLDERLLVRWPGLFPLGSKLMQALPARSRLRRAALRRSALSGWGAWLRSDNDLMLVRFAPNCRYEPPPEWQAVGMQGAYHGHAGLLEWSKDMREAWEWLENMPLEIVDAGDPLVFINRIRLRARGSGVEFEYRAGLVLWLEKGLIVRERDFLDADEALREVGASSA